MTDDPAGFVTRFFEDFRAVAGRARRAERVDHPRRSSTSDELDRLVRLQPETAWPLVLRLIKDAPDMEALAYVAAGPLEELIGHHGDIMVATIVDEAGHNRALSEALGMVWGWESLDPSVRDPLIDVMPPDTRDVLRGDMEILDRYRAKQGLDAPLFAPDRDGPAAE
jgi:hypothetical protein